MAEKEPPKVSMSNTKKDILEAYEELLKQYKEKKEQSLDAKERIEEIKTEKALAIAESLSPERVLKEIGDVKASIGVLLGQVSDQLETEVSKLESIQHAIRAKEVELKEIYSIEKEAGSLVALVETQKQMKEESETSLAQRRRELEEEIRKTRSEWEKEKERHAEEVVERSVADKRQRQREKEEFQYEFEKEKRRAKDQFEEEQLKLQKELRLSREELDRREEAVAARENELDELRQKVDGFQKELDTAVSRTTQETTKRLAAEAQTREELLKKEFEGERNVLVTRIESLEKTITEQTQQIKHLSQTQDKAYQQVQDIALKAVESAGNLRSLSQMIGAQKERQKTGKEQ